MSTIRRQRLAATTTTTAGLAFVVTAFVVALPGLVVLGAAAAFFGATALVALRPRYARTVPVVRGSSP